jgi:biotin carboxylase
VDRVLLLVPSATYRAGDFLAAARSLGAEVVVGSDVAPAVASAGGSVQIALGDPVAAAEAIVALDRDRPLDAVVAVDDQGVVAAALAAERLGLVHNAPDAVAATRDKRRLRERLGEAEVPQPVWVTIDALAGAAEVLRLTRSVGFPCVVKPTTLSGSQGVVRVDDEAGALATVDRVRAIARAAGVDPTQPLLVERFVPGPEVAVEAVLRAGSLTVLAVFDKPDPLDGPYFEETIYVTPSRLGAADLAAVAATTRAAAAALGLAEGPVHAELRVGGGRAWLIELAARSIGGLCSRVLEFGTGVSLEHLVLSHALGRPLDTRPRRRAAGVLMVPIPRAGTLLGVDGVDEARRLPGVTGVELTITPGRTLVPVPEGNRYLGFVLARGERPAVVEATLRRARSVLEVRVDPGDASACCS